MKMTISSNIIFCDMQMRQRKNFSKNRKNIYQEFINLKKENKQEEFDLNFDLLFKNKLIRKTYLEQCLFPKKIEDIGKKLETPFTDNLYYEIRWHTKVLSKYSDILNEILERKYQIDQFLFEENYQSALDILECIEKEYGYSIWGLETKITIYNNLGKNTDSLIAKKKGNLSIIQNFYGLKSDKEISFEEYDFLINRFINQNKTIKPELIATIDFINYILHPFGFQKNNLNILNILKRFNYFSLIDRYICLLDFLEYFFVINDEKFKKNMSIIINYFSNIEDSYLSTYKYLFNGNSLNNLYDEEAKLINMYINGEVEECYKLSKMLIETSKFDINIYNLFINSSLQLNKKIDEINVQDNVRIVLNNLCSIYCINEDYDEKIELIKKKCMCSLFSNWSKDIILSIELYNSSFSKLMSKGYLKIKYLRHFNINSMLYFMNEAKNTDKFELINQDIPSTYTDFYINYLKNNYEALSRMCNNKELAELFSLKKYDFDRYSKYLNSNYSKINKNRCMKLMWENLNTTIEIEKSIDYFIHMYIRQKNYLSIAPIEKFVKILSGEESDKKSIRIPIVFYIANESNYFKGKFDISLLCEDFFDNNNIEKPSLMLENKFEKEELIYFLKFICNQHILGPVLINLHTSKELDEERINICQRLCKLDDGHEEEYKSEIKEITNKLFINDGIKEYETHKIYVNIDGIKANVIKDIKPLYAKYQHDKKQKYEPYMNILGEIGNEADVVIYDNNIYNTLNEMQIRIRDEFVLGAEYGLDSCLSINIRHGTLKSKLKAPLTKEKLYAEFNFEKNEYDVDKKWFSKFDKFKQNAIKEAIIKFTKETDAIIDNLKNNLIQISTEQKVTQGVFEYDFNKINVLYKKSKDDTVEELMDNVFDILWGMTEYNLNRIKKIIRSEIKKDYINAFSKLRDMYKKINVRFPEAERHIQEIQNEIDKELENICEWFNINPDGQSKDFKLDDAFNVSLQTIKNVHPEQKFEIKTKNSKCEEVIKGVNWKYYCNIFYILLDNISLYAKKKDNCIFIDCIFKYSNDSIYIKITNDFDCTRNFDSSKEKIEDIIKEISSSSYLIQAQKEGGTGLIKIKKIMEYDLQIENIKINPIYLKNENKFYLEIEGDHA